MSGSFSQPRENVHVSIEEAFSSYAQAFVETFEDGNWSRLESFFSPNAVFLPGDRREFQGRQDVLNHLRQSWEIFDRLFDSRIPTVPPRAAGRHRELPHSSTSIHDRWAGRLA